jgi:hypothetical protein
VDSGRTVRVRLRHAVERNLGQIPPSALGLRVF